METEVVGMLFRHSTLMDFVYKHGDLTHAHSASTMTHEEKLALDYIDRETEDDMSIHIITRRRDLKQAMIIATETERHIVIRLKYIHPEIRDLFSRECGHLGWTE